MRKNHNLSVRMTKEEKEAVLNRANYEDKSLSDLARERLLHPESNLTNSMYIKPNIEAILQFLNPYIKPRSAPKTRKKQTSSYLIEDEQRAIDVVSRYKNMQEPFSYYN